MSKAPDFVACQQCALDPVCHPGLENVFSKGKTAIGEFLENFVLENMERRRSIAAHQTIYCQEQPVDAIYAVTSGAFKLVRQDQNGHPQVIGFRFPGELLGDEALAVACHSVTAMALTDASVCVIPLDIIGQASAAMPGFQQVFLRLIIQQCFLAHQQFSDYVGLNSAEQKLAAFLLHLTKRNTTTDNDITRIILQMSRTDIASYLGLRHETLSRTLSKLQQHGLVKTKGKQIHLIDPNRLSSLASGNDKSA